MVTGAPLVSLHPAGHGYLTHHYLRASLRDASNDTYDGHWHQWRGFCYRKHYPEYLYPNDPIRSEDCILEFLMECRIVRLNRANTVKTKKAAIKCMFERAGFPDPTSGRRISLVIRGMKNEDGPERKTKQPITRRHLLGIYEDFQAQKLGKRGSAIWAAACLCLFFCLRSKNAVSNDKTRHFDPRYIIKRRDIRFLAGQGQSVRVIELTPETAPSITRMVVRVGRTKTGPGFQRAINVNKHPLICVVKAVISHLLATPGLPGDAPVCAFDDFLEEGQAAKLVVTKQELAAAAKATALRLGDKVEDYATHSFRIGSATAMAAAGFPDSFTMYWGHWKSASYRLYIRHTEEDPWESKLPDALISQDLNPTQGQHPLNGAWLWGED